MFARLTKFQIKLHKVDEGINVFKNSVIPAAKQQKGFSGIYLMIDDKTGNGASLSFWESEADAKANEENRYYQEQLVKFMGFLTEPAYIREGFDVKLKD